MRIIFEYENLIKSLRNCLDCLCGECKYEYMQKPGNFVQCMNAIIAEAANAIEELTAADVRPVVTCGECKHYRGRPWENNATGICSRTDCGVRIDDFCSYGIRGKMEES